MLQTNTYSTAGVFYFIETPFIFYPFPSLSIYGAAFSLVWLLFYAFFKMVYL